MIGEIVITVNGDGFHMIMGDVGCLINSTGLCLDLNRFIIRAGSSGFSIENVHQPFDPNAYGVAFPSGITIPMPRLSSPPVPKIPPPPMPSVPDVSDVLDVPRVQDVPSIDLPSTGFWFFKGPERQPGDKNSYLEDGESILYETQIIKTRWLIKKTRTLFITDRNRIFYTTPNYSDKRGEIVLGTRTTIVPKNDDTLIVKNKDGKKYDMKFIDNNRDEWKKHLQDVFEQTVN